MTLVESPAPASADEPRAQLTVSKSSKIAAYQGDIKGTINLGDSYYHGQGVVQDYTKAVELYTLAANKGDAEGQCNLAYMYNNGKGMAQDCSKAVELYTLASNQGHARA
ncbi:hypothetical protein BDR26DRAFT_983839, partial [Obelidium mucronatum]